MADPNSAVSTLINQVLTDPDLAHSDVFRQMLQLASRTSSKPKANADSTRTMRSSTESPLGEFAMPPHYGEARRDSCSMGRGATSAE